MSDETTPRPRRALPDDATDNMAPGFLGGSPTTPPVGPAMMPAAAVPPAAMPPDVTQRPVFQHAAAGPAPVIALGGPAAAPTPAQVPQGQTPLGQVPPVQTPPPAAQPQHAFAPADEPPAPVTAVLPATETVARDETAVLDETATPADEITAPSEEAAAPGEETTTPTTGPARPEHFRQTMWRTIASTVVPFSGLIKTKWRIPALVVAILFVVGLVSFAIVGVLYPTKLIHVVMHPTLMRVATVVSAVGAVLWVVNIAGTYLINRPSILTRGKQAAGSIGVLIMSLLISTPLAVASAYAWQSANAVETIFGDVQSGTTPTVVAGNPWGGLDRVNVLLLGGDSGEGRSDKYGIRTDSILVASINVHTGDTVLIQIPRNMARTPFPPDSQLAKYYPRGFYDGHNSANAEFLINAIWRNVPAAHPDLFPESTYPGADALKLGVGETIGLRIDYFLLLNIDGIQQLVDAMGGVTVNVNFDIAMGGNSEDGCKAYGYVQHGANQHLDGEQAMWYARSRCNDPLSDYGRMQRQSCLINAIIDQANPAVMLTRYEQIAASAKDMMMTDIPQSLLSDFVDLSWKVKDANVTRVTFIGGQDGFFSGNPNFTLMRQRVALALSDQDTSTGTAPSTGPATGPATATATTGPGGNPPAPPATAATSRPPSATASVAPPEDLTDACAYNPTTK